MDSCSFSHAVESDFIFHKLPSPLWKGKQAGLLLAALQPGRKTVLISGWADSRACVGGSWHWFVLVLHHAIAGCSPSLCWGTRGFACRDRLGKMPWSCEPWLEASGMGLLPSREGAQLLLLLGAAASPYAVGLQLCLQPGAGSLEETHWHRSGCWQSTVLL